MTCLGLWVYADATIKSDQEPLLWVLIVLLVPNLLGLLIYMLVGRTNKTATSPGKYLKLLIASALALIPAIVIFIVGVVGFAGM